VVRLCITLHGKVVGADLGRAAAHDVGRHARGAAGHGPAQRAVAGVQVLMSGFTTVIFDTPQLTVELTYFRLRSGDSIAKYCDQRTPWCNYANRVWCFDVRQQASHCPTPKNDEQA
jgi:hypothetical protein